MNERSFIFRGLEMVTEESLTRGERTRAAILEAAQELFLENGYQGTSMRQIAERAGGIAVGGIYNHFGSKEDLFRQLIEARHPYERIMAVLEEARGESGPELLGNALREAAAIAREYVDFVQLVYIDLQEFDGTAMVGLMGRLIPAILSFAQQVMEAGGLRPGITPFAMMRVFASLIIGYALTERIGFSEGRPRTAAIPDMMSQAEWIEAYVDVYLHGVAAEG